MPLNVTYDPTIAQRNRTWSVETNGSLYLHPTTTITNYSQPYSYIDLQGTAGAAANAYQNAADQSMGGSVDTSGLGLDFGRQGIGAAQDAIGRLNTVFLPAIQQGVGNTQGYATRTNQFADEAAGSAASMTGNIGNVQNQAALVNQQGQALRPYAQTLRGMADTLWSQGLGLNAQGNSILSLDPNASGIAGEMARWVQSIDPNRYVSMAAADVQSAGDNAAGQMLRAGTRAGQDASSSAMQAQRDRLYASLAATLAGAKTRARQQGLAERGQALQGALQSAQSLLSQGMQAQNAAANTQNAAAGVEANAGQLMGQAGQLHGQAGQLQQGQANAYTAAGQLAHSAGGLEAQAVNLMTTYGNLTLDASKALVNAYGNATSAADAMARLQQDAAMYYAQVAQGFGEMAGASGIFNARFGDQVPAPGQVVVTGTYKNDYFNNFGM